jgi:hypothetical protein
MSRLEEALKDKKEELDRLEAPEELEARLRQSLFGRKRRMAAYKPVAAVLIVVLLLTYSFDTLAYYGKKFTGYDQMTAGSLKQLNEQGRGQEIGKSCTFSNGVEVTIDGIMFDDNELVAFYKVHSNNGKLLEDVLNYKLPKLHAYGIKPGGYRFTGGQGTTVDSWNMTFVDTLETPAFYEKWMRFDVELVINKKLEVRSISFTLDRNQAMERTVKTDLNAEARLGDYRIIFDRLTASTMSSVLDGRIIALTDDALKVFKAESAEAGTEIPRLRFDIVSDHGEVSQFYGGSQSASGSDISFSSRSDALPDKFNTLQIRNIRIDTMKLVDKTVDVNVGIKDLQIAGDLMINQVYQEGDETFVAVSSRGIPIMGLLEGEKQLEPVNPEAFDREAESTQLVERVYRFKGTGSNLKLAVKFIRYSRYSTDAVDIPVE